ncbi:MAG: tRNA (N6-threonylcarbamoyladenosine(37)-N6)-methyltransferase TrmO [Spirochaetes bacterium]|jgi:tRNA-Thr(GGU) m(6)t(6)A37 methyltransferase TsaA|nr:tRNA (N6-threonylcarbamoyladenosine(37)-N6)-methyltransferase TrmO [Spirochaetota bacterium]
MNEKYLKFKPIGVIHSEHTDPAMTPIQPAYAHGCRGYAEIFPQYTAGLKDLDGFSHIYIIYHLHRAGPARMLVKPFLDDVERGVFSTRHPARPNPIGLSIVELIKVKGVMLHLDGVDMLDGTPIIDIKPYVKKFDRMDPTRDGWQDLIDETKARKKGTRGLIKENNE